jgi:hypothetical protein
MGSSITNNAKDKNDENDVHFRRTAHACCLPIQAEPETVSSPSCSFHRLFQGREKNKKKGGGVEKEEKTVLFSYCFAPAKQLMVMGLKIWSLSNPVLNQGPFDHWPTSLPML